MLVFGYKSLLSSFMKKLSIYFFYLIFLIGSSLITNAQVSNQELPKDLNPQQRGQLEYQAEQLRQYLEKNPRSSEAHLNLANIYWQLGRPGKPISHYSAAIKLNPQFAEAYYNLGNVFFVQGEYEQALAAYKRAVAIKSNYASAYKGLANTYLDAEKFDLAIENYKKSLNIEPTDTDSQYNLCTAYLFATYYQEAVQSCLKVANTTKDARAYNNVGNAHFRLGNLDQAIQAYTLALNIQPGLPEAHFNIGAIYLLKGDKDSAIQRQKALEIIDPQKSKKLVELIAGKK